MDEICSEHTSTPKTRDAKDRSSGHFSTIRANHYGCKSLLPMSEAFIKCNLVGFWWDMICYSEMTVLAHTSLGTHEAHLMDVATQLIHYGAAILGAEAYGDGMK